MLQPSTAKSWFQRLYDTLVPEGPLSRKAAGLASGRLIQFGALIVVNAWLARALTPSTLGDYQKLWLLHLTFSPVLLMGLPQSINVFLPRTEFHRRGQVLMNFLLFQAIVATPALVVFFIKPAWLAALIGAPHLAPLVPLSGLYIMLVLPTFYMESLCVVENRIGFFVRVLVLHSVLFTVGHITASLWGDVKPLMLCIIIVITVRLGFTVWLATRLYSPFSGGVSTRLLQEIVPYALPLFFTALLDILTINIDKFIVSHFFTSEQFAIYTLGAVEVPLIFFLTSAVQNVMIPEMTQTRDRERLEYLVRASTGKLALLLIPFFFFSLACADFVIPIVFSKAYKETAAIFIIYLFLIPQRALHVLPVLWTKQQKRHILIGRVIDLVINVALGVGLIPLLGLWAPAIGVVVATHLNKFYFLWVMWRNLGMRLSKLAPWDYVAKVCAVSGALGGIFYLIRIAVEHKWLGFGLGAAVYCLVAVPLILKERRKVFH